MLKGSQKIIANIKHTYELSKTPRADRANGNFQKFVGTDFISPITEAKNQRFLTGEKKYSIPHIIRGVHMVPAKVSII